jgi:hypothetical protein
LPDRLCYRIAIALNSPLDFMDEEGDNHQESEKDESTEVPETLLIVNAESYDLESAFALNGW